MFWNYDGDWATRKVKLGYTPHFASYDIEQKVVTVACSREEKIEMLIRARLHLQVGQAVQDGWWECKPISSRDLLSSTRHNGSVINFVLAMFHLDR